MVYMYVKKCVGEITWPKRAHAQSLFWAVKTKLKANRASEIEEQRIRPKTKKTKNHENQRLATLKRLKRGDDNEF